MNYDELPLLQPYLTVYLFVGTETKTKRLRERADASRSDILLEQNIDIQAAVEHAFEAFPMFHVDTSERDVDDVVDLILTQLDAVKIGMANDAGQGPLNTGAAR